MLDGISLDQLRTFIAAADAGSFSAAARRLRRAQSAVSQTISTLEAQLRVPLFDRSARYPQLTEPGRLLLADARAVIAEIDALKARARGMAGGLEPELSVAVDVMVPMQVITHIAAGFREAFPATPLHLYVEVLGGVAQSVHDGTSNLGIVSSLIPDVPALAREPLFDVPMVMVAAGGHPLASHAGPVPPAVLARHTQLVLTDRSGLSAGQTFAVLSPRIWRLADLGAKHEFLRAGLGWGGMPRHRVEPDLAAGTLVRLALDSWSIPDPSISFCATYPTDSLPGPAGRWLIDQLRIAAAGCASPHLTAS